MCSLGSPCLVAAAVAILYIYIYNPLSHCPGQAGGEDFMYKIGFATSDHL